MSEESRNPGWNWTGIDWAALTGIEITQEQIDQLRLRTDDWGPDLGVYDLASEVYDDDPAFSVDHPYPNDKDKWEKLQRRCAAAWESIQCDDLHSAILAALEYKKIQPRDANRILPSPPDLAYVANILRALADADRPTSDFNRRARDRRELAAVIGQWWYEVTETEPTKDWQKFSDFLLALVNLEIPRSTFYKYWNKPEIRYSQGVVR